MEGEEVQEASGVARKRKRVGIGGGGEDATASEEAADGGGVVYGKDELLGEEGIAEEAVAEVMRWLEAEIADNAAFAAPPTSPPGFVTINGSNEESCGPSFSAAASTVMASVDTRAGKPPVPWPWPEPEPVVPAPGGIGVDVEMGGAGEAADEEEWLARLLTCGALLEGVL